MTVALFVIAVLLFLLAAVFAFVPDPSPRVRLWGLFIALGLASMAGAFAHLYNRG